MKKSILFAFIVTILCAINVQGQEKAKVYFTSDISSESLIKIYQALGREATGRVAVKISTGEQGGNYYLHPELIGDFVKKVNGKSWSATRLTVVHVKRRPTIARLSKIMVSTPSAELTSWMNFETSIPVPAGSHLLKKIS